MLRQQMTETMYDDTIQHVRHIYFLNLFYRYTFSSIFSIILVIYAIISKIQVMLSYLNYWVILKMSLFVKKVNIQMVKYFYTILQTIECDIFNKLVKKGDNKDQPIVI